MFMIDNTEKQIFVGRVFEKVDGFLCDGPGLLLDEVPTTNKLLEDTAKILSEPTLNVLEYEQTLCTFNVVIMLLLPKLSPEQNKRALLLYETQLPREEWKNKVFAVLK
jgi:hypothetical protein